MRASEGHDLDIAEISELSDEFVDIPSSPEPRIPRRQPSSHALPATDTAVERDTDMRTDWDDAKEAEEVPEEVPEVQVKVRSVLSPLLAFGFELPRFRSPRACFLVPAYSERHASSLKMRWPSGVGHPSLCVPEKADR